MLRFTLLVSEGGLLGLPDDVFGVVADEQGHVEVRARALLHRSQKPPRDLRIEKGHVADQSSRIAITPDTRMIKW